MTSDFAHLVERALARLFDEHRIAWRYEPHTFVLERDERGQVREAFTPDFFLPDLDMYVECTVMRQPLTGRKRRKARLVRERAGAIVEILFRRDVERLASRWDLEELARAGRSKGEVSYSGRAGMSVPKMSERARMLETREDFRVDVDEQPDVSIVSVTGGVDLHSAPLLRDRLTALADSSVRHVVLDLSEATFLDSMALGVILGAKKRLASAQGRLDLVVSTPEIRRIFEITLLDRIFVLHETRAGAVHDGRGSAG